MGILLIVIGAVLIVAVAIAQPIAANQRRAWAGGAMVNGTKLTTAQAEHMKTTKPRYTWAWTLLIIGLVLLAVGILLVVV